MKLSPEQQIMVEANIGLACLKAFRYAGRLGLQHHDRELCRSAAYEALCRAALGYKASSGKFSSYAGRIIDREIATEINSRRLILIPKWTGIRCYANRPAHAQARAARCISSGTEAAMDLSVLVDTSTPDDDQE